MKNYTVKEILAKTTSLALLESQNEYREKIATFVRMHTIRANAINNGVDPKALPTISMLVVAETGCGKTYVASQIAKASGVNIITVDCSTLSRAGWRGATLATILSEKKKAIHNSDDFYGSIIHFDECDKLRFHHGSSPSAIEANPQYDLLSLFDGSVQSENSEYVDTSRMSFLFTGAFAEGGLKDIIKRRLMPPKTIGFITHDDPTPEDDLLSHVTMEDIKKYGILEELCGRINHVYYLPKLTPNDYRTLIRGENGSMLERYRNLFRTGGIDVEISDAACDILAEEARGNTLGARSVNPIVYEYFQRAVIAIEMEPAINKVTLDSTPEGELRLVYGQGDRRSAAKPTITEEPASAAEIDPNFKVPDVNFFELLRNTRDLRKLRKLAIDLCQPTGHGEARLLSAFLDCSLYYIWRFADHCDHTLNTLEELAESTRRIDRVSSSFDALMNKIVTNESANEEYREGLEKRYSKYLAVRGEDENFILADAVRRMRRNWYRCLMKSVG